MFPNMNSALQGLISQLAPMYKGYQYCVIYMACKFVTATDGEGSYIIPNLYIWLSKIYGCLNCK